MDTLHRRSSSGKAGGDEQPQRRLITSIYSGRCRRCQAPYRPGDGIWVSDTVPGALCELCMEVRR